MSESVPRAVFEVSERCCGEVLIHVVGEVDAAVAPEFGQRLTEVIETAGGDVIVDLADVTFMDSSGLAVLAQAHQRCRGRTRSLLLSHPSPAVIRLLELTGLDGWFGLR